MAEVVMEFLATEADLGEKGTKTTQIRSELKAVSRAATMTVIYALMIS